MFTILAIFLIAAYFLGDKDLLSPWFLLCLMIFAMFIIILLNYNNWDVEINGSYYMSALRLYHSASAEHLLNVFILCLQVKRNHQKKFRFLKQRL